MFDIETILKPHFSVSIYISLILIVNALVEANSKRKLSRNFVDSSILNLSRNKTITLVVPELMKQPQTRLTIPSRFHRNYNKHDDRVRPGYLHYDMPRTRISTRPRAAAPAEAGAEAAGGRAVGAEDRAQPRPRHRSCAITRWIIIFLDPTGSLAFTL